MTKVLISSDSKFPVKRDKIRCAVESVLRGKHVSSDVEVSVLICGARKSARLAGKYGLEASPHDVLSFPLVDQTSPKAYPSGKKAADFAPKEDGRLILGDIVVCYPLAQVAANRDNVLVDTKIAQLVSHGTLHLLGEHHNES